jgi:hypothetical protein
VTVAALHTALMAVNFAIAALLIVSGPSAAFVRSSRCGVVVLRPGAAVHGLLLIDANGANIEEFVFTHPLGPA